MQGVSPKNSDKQTTPPERSSTVVLMTIADTTWRIFVPSVGCTFLGIWLDGKWNTSPWVLFTGIVVGLVIAWFAVRRQYKRLINL